MAIPFLTPPQEATLRRFRDSGGLREMVSFLLIGGTGAVINIVLNVLFIKLGVRPSLSIAITLGLLVPPSYYLQHTLTFRSGRNHLSAFPRYAGAQAFGYLGAMGVAELFPEPFQAYPATASILMTASVAAVNYGILKFWAFRDSPAPVG